MKFLIYITFVLFSLGQLGRLSFFNQEANIYLYEISLAIALCVLVIRYRIAPIAGLYKKLPVAFWFLIFSLFSFIFSFLDYSPFRNLIAFLYFMRLLMYSGYGVYLAYFLKKETPSRRILSNGILLFFIVTVITSFVQYFLYPDLRNLIYQGWDPHLNRMFGVFFDTSVAAAIYGVSFLFLLSVKKKNYLLLALFLISLILTFARSGYIAFFIALLSVFISRNKARYIFICIALFVSLLLVAPKQFGPGVGLTRTFTIEARFNDYKEAIQLWSKKPFFGIGYNRIKRVVPSHASASYSSSYLIILVTGGIVGLLLFLATVVRFAFLHEKAVTLLLFIGVLSFFDNILLHPFILFLLGSFLADISFPSGRSPK